MKTAFTIVFLSGLCFSAVADEECNKDNYQSYVWDKEKMNRLIIDTDKGCQLQGADLQGADLQGAYLREADLLWAYLLWAYLQGADLQGADLREADLQEANLRGADLQGADLEKAKYDSSTKFPEGFDPEKHSMVMVSRVR